ncbi:MAG: class I SAM-dependent methyltransferase [Planctomycetaceae bacterium]|nr:class I SAM-dependent methyltransferase [Planctomycetaceae bacterium]
MDDDEDDIHPPNDWMNLEDWDRYWTRVLADDFWRAANMESWDFDRTGLAYLQATADRPKHRILFAGNGISPEPFGFSHKGCEVTVLDVSSVACRFVESLEVSADLLAPMFPEFHENRSPGGLITRRLNRESSRTRVEQEHRSGGSVKIVNADLFHWEPAGPFDAIFSRRAYQGFEWPEQEEIARRFYRWLCPGGIAFIEMLNIRTRLMRDVNEAPFSLFGFREIGWWSEANDVDRHVLFWHGSG